METVNMIVLLAIKINGTLRRQINKLQNKLIVELDGFDFIRFEIQCVCYCSSGAVHWGRGSGIGDVFPEQMELLSGNPIYFYVCLQKFVKMNLQGV